MAYYDALVAEWANLGPASATSDAIAAARTALAVAPPAEVVIPQPIAPATTLSEDQIVAFNIAIAARDATISAQHEAYAGIFHASAVLSKLASLNAQTVAGPDVDVSVSSVVGLLMLDGVLPTLMAFSQGSPNQSQPHDGALASAKTLVTLISTPNAPGFGTSNPGIMATVKAMADVLLAYETATPGATGFNQAVHDALLALATTTIPWWRSAGYSSSIGTGDLEAVFVSSSGATVLT